MRFFILALFVFISCESSLLAAARGERVAATLVRQAFRALPTGAKELVTGSSIRFFSGRPKKFRFANQRLEELRRHKGRRVLLGDGFLVQNVRESDFRQALNEQLLTYAKNADGEGIEACLKEGADANFINPASGDTLYHLLARHPNQGAASNIIYSLLQRGIGSPEALNNQGKTPYRVALEGGNMWAVAFFPSDTRLR